MPAATPQSTTSPLFAAVIGPGFCSEVYVCACLRRVVSASILIGGVKGGVEGGVEGGVSGFASEGDTGVGMERVCVCVCV